MLLQVHDELIFETTDKQLRELASLVKHEMETAVTLSVRWWLILNSVLTGAIWLRFTGRPEMPELPEVETIRRTLESRLLKQRIRGGKVLHSKLVQGKLPDAFLKEIQGHSIEALDRRGKYLLIRLSGASPSACTCG